ncbi:MAG: 3-isopropylmalate dehydratase small subunit [Syntrophales bacterium]|nr:3-isopropylmalate dehydratase small subunit [Syntrophales bacterium]
MNYSEEDFKGMEKMRVEGRIWKFGDDVDTDVIIPARYLNVSAEAELAKNCFADIRPDFATDVAAGDILVAGKNFGCGSSREHAPLAIKAAGIRVIIAESFARIFYRNAFNIGLPLLESVEASQGLSDGEKAVVDLASGRIEGGGDTFQAKPIPDFMAQLIAAGGLVAYVRKVKVAG